MQQFIWIVIIPMPKSSLSTDALHYKYWFTIFFALTRKSNHSTDNKIWIVFDFKWKRVIRNDVKNFEILKSSIFIEFIIQWKISFKKLENFPNFSKDNRI